MEYLQVFAVGGCICLAGQLLMDFTRLSPARILVIFVCAGALLTGLGLYEPLAEFGKSGATVPLPGFGYQLAKGAIEGAREEGLLGALSGGIQNTGAGIGAAIFFGYLIALLFHPRPKP